MVTWVPLALQNHPKGPRGVPKRTQKGDPKARYKNACFVSCFFSHLGPQRGAPLVLGRLPKVQGTWKFAPSGPHLGTLLGPFGASMGPLNDPQVLTSGCWLVVESGGEKGGRRWEPKKASARECLYASCMQGPSVLFTTASLSPKGLLRGGPGISSKSGPPGGGPRGHCLTGGEGVNSALLVTPKGGLLLFLRFQGRSADPNWRPGAPECPQALLSGAPGIQSEVQDCTQCPLHSRCLHNPVQK